MYSCPSLRGQSSGIVGVVVVEELVEVPLVEPLDAVLLILVDIELLELDELEELDDELGLLLLVDIDVLVEEVVAGVLRSRIAPTKVLALDSML